MTFSLSRTPVDLTDCRMGTLPPTTFNDETRLETYHDERETPPICLGGYPSFTHEDPRRYNHPSAMGDFYLLASDSNDGIMWGGSGVAQFSIHEDNCAPRLLESTLQWGLLRSVQNRPCARYAAMKGAWSGGLVSARSPPSTKLTHGCALRV